MKSKNNKKTLRIGLAQMDCELGNVEGNIEKSINIIEKYRDKVDLLIFPELSLTGYSVGENFHKYALRTEGQRFKKLINSTKDIAVAVGFIEEAPSFSFFNSLAFIKDKKIIHTHRKIYLPTYGIFEEKKYFSSGAKFQSFNHGSFRIAPFICGDAWNPALAHIAAADEANIFVFPACSPDYSLGGKMPNDESWKTLSRFYAMIYGSHVVFVNRTGTERNLTFHGNSSLINPFGETIAEIKGDTEDVAIGEIDLDSVREARIALHTMRDENLHFIQDQLSRIINNKNYL